MADDVPLPDLPALPEVGWDVSEAPAALREATLRSTLSVVRGRRHRRRAVLAAAALVLFGLGTAFGAQLGDASPRGEGPGGGRGTSPQSSQPSPPAELMARIDDAPARERVALLRRAGDAYLSPTHADPASALRCYRQLMADTGAEPHRDTDTWLLSYLKLARR